MELLDRYLNAVRFLLPKAHQDDIIAEIREDLRSQMEDREAELGRALTDDDVCAILKQRGQPMLVAARYAPQQHLIGPVLLPIYMFVLKLVVLWILLPVFALIVGPIVVFTSANPSVALLQAMWGLVVGAVFSFGVITLVFAILERFPDQTLNKWDPRKLPQFPAFPVEQTVRAKIARAFKPASRSTAVTELVAGIVASVGWTYLVWFHPNLNFGADTTVRVTLAPIWHTFFWPILVVLLSGVPIGLVTLLEPSAVQVRSIFRIAIQCLSLIVACILLTSGPWIELASHSIPPASLQEATKWSNIGVQIGIGVAGIVNIVEIAQEVFRLVFRRSMRTSGLAV